MAQNTPGTDKTQDAMMFFSFVQCSARKSMSNDSGIIKDKNNVDEENVVCLISDDESDVEEPQMELLYSNSIAEVEFNTACALPLPIETKLFCKPEHENIQESTLEIAPVRNSMDSNTLDLIENAGQVDCSDDEILPLCKFDPDMNLTDRRDASIECEDFNCDNYMIFICPQCGLECNTSGRWREHMNKSHNLCDPRTYHFVHRPNNEFECGTCQTVLSRCTNKTLQQHYFTHLPYKAHKCKLCHYEVRSLYLMISHVMLHKEREELDVVAVSVAKSTVPQNSVALEQACRCLIAYSCPICPETFDVEQSWQAHINFKHNFLEKTAENRYKDHFKCTECNMEIFSQHISDLQQHLFTHLPNKSILKCKICNWTISRINVMVSHILHLHKNELSAANGTTIYENNSSNKLNNSSIEDKSVLNSTPIAKLPSMSVIFNYDLNDEEDNELIESIRPTESIRHIENNHAKNGVNNANIISNRIITRATDTGTTNNNISRINNRNRSSVIQNSNCSSIIDQNSSCSSSINSINQNNTIQITEIASPINSLETLSDDNPPAKKGKYVKTGYKCTGCDRSFSTPEKRNAHNISTHPKYKCKNCEAPFALKNELKRHRCNEDTFQCNICGVHFSIESSYEAHVLVHHGNGSLKRRRQRKETDPDYVR